MEGLREGLKRTSQLIEQQKLKANPHEAARLTRHITNVLFDTQTHCVKRHGLIGLAHLTVDSTEVIEAQRLGGMGACIVGRQVLEHIESILQQLHSALVVGRLEMREAQRNERVNFRTLIVELALYVEATLECRDGLCCVFEPHIGHAQTAVALTFRRKIAEIDAKIETPAVVLHRSAITAKVVVDQAQRVVAVGNPALITHFRAHSEAPFEKLDGEMVVLLHLEYIPEVLRYPANVKRDLPTWKATCKRDRVRSGEGEPNAAARQLEAVYRSSISKTHKSLKFLFYRMHVCPAKNQKKSGTGL